MSSKKKSTKGHKTEGNLREGEIFPRIRIDDLVSLLLQWEATKDDAILLKKTTKKKGSKKGKSKADEEPEADEPDPSSSQRHGFSNLINGVGERMAESLSVSSRDSGGGSSPSLTRPFLLVDVRSEEEFRSGRLTTAVNYPQRLLSRATNWESRDLATYRNRPGSRIFLYDAGERQAPDVASTLVQRGYANVSLLTGGLQAVKAKYPKALYGGPWPSELVSEEGESKPSKGRGKRSASVPAAEEARPPRAAFDDEDLEELRQQLQWNRLPPYARTSYGKETTAARSRRREASERRSGDKGKADMGWR